MLSVGSPLFTFVVKISWPVMIARWFCFLKHYVPSSNLYVLSDANYGKVLVRSRWQSVNSQIVIFQKVIDVQEITILRSLKMVMRSVKVVEGMFYSSNANLVLVLREYRNIFWSKNLNDCQKDLLQALQAMVHNFFSLQHLPSCWFWC